MGLISTRSGTACASLVFAAALTVNAAFPATASSQTSGSGAWSVRSIRFEADLTAGDGSADVTLRYVFVSQAGGDLPLASPIDVELLDFGEASVERFTVVGGPGVELWPTTGGHRAAAVYAPAGVAGDVLPLEFRYRVSSAVEEREGALRARIPVLTGPAAPATGEGGGFEARLLLPEAWAPSEGFPSGLRMNDDGVYTVALAAAPAMVGFRGRSDGSRRPGLPLLVDVLTLAILLSFSMFGWRHLRGVAQRANS